MKGFRSTWNMVGGRRDGGRTLAGLAMALLIWPAPEAVRADPAPQPAVFVPPAPQSGAAPGPGSGETASPELVKPTLLEFVDAEYPSAAQQAGLEAAVKLSLKLDEQGNVTEVSLVEPAGQGFDEAAMAAARRLRFSPARLGDRPVGVEIRFTYRFVLEQRRVTPVAVAEAPPVARTEPPRTLVGRVLRRGDREPLAGIGVRIQGTDLATETSPEGRFALTVAPGSWTVALSHPDILPYETTEEVRPAEIVEVTYYAEAKSHAAYRTVVTAARPLKTVTRTTLESLELVRVPGTFGEPFRVVQTLPGVARAPYGTGFLIVRGSSPADTGFFLDGHEIPLLYHFLAGPAVFQAELVQSIDFYPGNFPVVFGRKQAGLVTTRTKEQQQGERVHGLASLDLLDMEALLQVPIGEDASVSAAFRRSHFDLFLPLFTNAVSPRYWDYQVIGTSRLGGAWRGKLTIFGSSDALDIKSEPETEDDPGASNQAALGIRFHRLHAAADRPVGQGGRLELSFKGGLDQVLMGFNESYMNVDMWEGTVRGELSWPLPPWLGAEELNLQAGAEFQANHLAAEMNFPGGNALSDFPHPSGMADEATTPRLIYEFDGQPVAPALYASLEYRRGPLLVIPGLRLDLFHYETWTRLVADPRLIVRWQAAEPLTFKGGVGLFHQLDISQQQDELYGSPDEIDVPYAVQYSVGAEYRPWDWFDLDASFFYNDYRAQLSSTPLEEQQGVATGGPGFNSEGRGRSYGLELLVRHRPHGPFFGWIAYTLSRAERRAGDDPWQLFALDQTHILTAVGSVALGSRWTLGLKFQLTTGNPRTPVIGGVYDSDTNRYRPVLGAPLSERNQTYHQLDFRVDRTFLFDTWKLVLYLDLLNLYNRKNTEFVTFNYDYTESAVVQGFPFFPSFGVKGEF